MELQKLMDEMSKGWRAQRGLDQLTLGKAIDTLENMEESLIRFDDGTTIGVERSYRGYYSDLSISSGEIHSTTNDLLYILKKALGATYQGYKGGDFVMDKHTPLWQAEYGSCGRKMMGFAELDGTVIIITEEDDD